jgi:pimeloyl-ACP methyl ester carboxylesterase
MVLTAEESYHVSEGEIMFLRLRNPGTHRPALLFVHGLGDSGLVFEDVFRFDQFADCNIVIPDLIGYGRSSAAADDKSYGFEAHRLRLWTLIQDLELREIVLVAHSMGADIATFLCQSDHNGIIKKFVCVESDITQHEMFLSRKASEADQRGKYAAWFEGIRGEIGYRLLRGDRSGRLYYSSLQFCRPEAFRQDSIDLVKRANVLSGPYRSEMGAAYCRLQIPRVFCYGTRSLAKESLEYLAHHQMEVKAFEGAKHSPMTDQPERFYPFLYEFITRPE